MPRPDPRQQAKKTARLRLLLKAPLGWLGGFPLELKGLGVRWWTPASAADPIDVLGPTELRRASKALLEIRSELRETLPQLVPDPDRWLKDAEKVLEAAGRMVHHGVDPESISPPDLPGLGDLARRHPRLRPLADAVAWSLWTRPEDGKKVVRWLLEHARTLDALFEPEFEARVDFEPLVPAMDVVSAAAVDGIDDAAALLEALAHPDVDIETRFRVATKHVESLLPSKELVESLRAGKINNRITVPGRTNARSELLAFILRWTAWEAPRRRATAHVWRLVYDARLFRLWASWWRQIGEIREKLNNFQELERTLADPVATLADLEKRLRKRLDGARFRRMPATFVVPDMLQALTELSESAELIRSVRRALDMVSPTWVKMPTHQAYVLHWNELRPDYPRQLRRHIDSFRRLVAAGGKRALAPWAVFFHEAYGGDFLTFTVDDYALDWHGVQALDSVPMVRAAVEIFHLPLEHIRLVSCLCLVGADVAMAREAVKWAFDQGCGLRDYFGLGEPLRYAVAIAPDAESLGRILLRLDRLTDSEPADLLLDGARRLTGRPGSSSKQALAWAVVDRIDRDPSALVDLGRRQRLMKSLGTPDSPTLRDDDVPDWPGSTDRTWVDGYPAQLRSDLHLLADYDLDCETTARRILRRDVRDLRSLERELDAVTQRATQAAGEDERHELEARCDKLEAWIRQPQVLAEGKLFRLRDKLRRAALSARLADVRERLDERISGTLRRMAEKYLEEVPISFDPILDPDVVLLLEAVSALKDKAARRFGLEVLLRRCGPAPWDLRNHPDNLRFRRRMDEARIDLQPWIDDPFRQTYDAADGQPLTLELERDPIRVLRMGAPWGTCLSPWDFNFFSAVTNAVDLDKQVVYGRDAKGRIQARCLLAIGRSAETDAALIAFYPYAHDEEIGFRELMARYAGELADAMGLPRASKGRVSPLVCPNWYDDGPHDLSGDLDFLEEGQPFRDSLKTIEPEALADALVDAAPRPVDAPILAALLVRIQNRPQLVVGLVQWIDRLRLPALDRLSAAALARRAGRDDLAQRWLEMCAGHLRGRSNFPWWNRPLGETLAELAPSLVLRLLRETRPQGVRYWTQETNAHRLWVAGKAHVALHRKKKALEFFQRIIERRSYTADWVVGKARRAVDALEV